MSADYKEIWKLGLYLPVLLILMMAPDPPAHTQSLSGIDIKWLEERGRSLKWGRDPFLVPQETGEVPKEKDEVSEPPLSLSAIIYRDGSGIAIINNKIVRVGDIIEKMELTGIMEDRVTLKGPRGEEELRVNKFALER